LLRALFSAARLPFCQLKSGEYDADANRHLMNLYAFNPELVKPDTLAVVSCS